MSQITAELTKMSTVLDGEKSLISPLTTEIFNYQNSKKMGPTKENGSTDTATNRISTNNADSSDTSKADIFLFDLDGTLTKVRQKMTPEMKLFLHELSEKHSLVIVSGSDYAKIKDQIDDKKLVEKFKYIFSENGSLIYQEDKLIGRKNIIQFLGEDRLKKLINFSLKYIADLDIPVKRGTFIELREGMINICPIGRSCSLEERLEFFEYDNIHHVREKFLEKLEKEFSDWKMYFTLGAQISIDAYPIGWDKSSCLEYLQGYNINFFGDQTIKGGNDYVLSIHPQVNCSTVTSPEDTMNIIRTKFKHLNL